GGDNGAVFVGAGDQPAVDVADIGLMGVAADHDVDGAVEVFDDVDDGAGNAGAFIVIAGGIAAFVDQYDDGLDATRLQFRHQRVHRLGLVPEFQSRDARRRDDAGRTLQRQADERHRDALEFPD